MLLYTLKNNVIFIIITYVSIFFQQNINTVNKVTLTLLLSIYATANLPTARFVVGVGQKTDNH